MIRVNHLTIAYDDANGVFDLSMEIPTGSTCAIIGPSGCGKTTLLHGLAGFLRIDKGSIELTGGQQSTRVGLVQQKDALFPWLKARENVALGLRGSALKPAEKRELVMDLLSSLGIAQSADKYPGKLSGGQRQRISIARSLIGNPDILLMDEPTASLDAFSKEALQDLLLKIHQENPVTTLFVTHSIEEALFLGEKVLIMGQGRIYLEQENPLYPDPVARVHSKFYEEVVALRDKLGEVSTP
jgi:NitT/TauT family transport system ATP-binding protein